MNSGFHSGERAVQQQAGVQALADRVGPSIHIEMPKAAQEFLLRQPMVVLGYADTKGRVWASVLAGRPGFVHALNSRTVALDTLPVFGDPLNEVWRDETEAGLLAIELSSRRRMRVNGRLALRKDGGMALAVRQAYANCPKYIQAREWEYLPEMRASAQPVQSEQLAPSQQEWIARADTFFIATTHPDAGADASHRGGAPGFFKVVDAETLVFPDYAGNNMFNTLGNLVVNPHAGIVFIDFESGSTLQITGQARVIWGEKRTVEFQITQIIETAQSISLRGRLLEASPFNP